MASASFRRALSSMASIATARDRPHDVSLELDRNGRVVYVAFFSKVLLSMLPPGFLVAPASLRPAPR
jgi:DNA-binding transcriptional MocR family regulator